MKSNKVVDIIKRVCGNEGEPNYINNDEVFTALVHSYYYVESGKDFRRLINKVNKAISEGTIDAAKQFNEGQGAFPLEVYLSCCTSEKVLKIIRESFNLNYFESQIDCIKDEELNDEKLIEEYLDMFTTTQLKNYLGIVNQFVWCHALFMELNTSLNLDTILNSLCRQVDSSVPDVNDESTSYEESKKFLKENPYYMFDYLDKDKITEIIREHITDNRVLAANAARMFFHSNDLEFVYHFILMAESCRKLYGVNVF